MPGRTGWRRRGRATPRLPGPRNPSPRIRATRVEAPLHLRIAERRGFGGEHEVARGGQSASPRERPALHDRYDRLGDASHTYEDLGEPQRRLAVFLDALVGGCEQLVQVHAGAKIASGATHRDDPHGGVEIGLVQQSEQDVDHGSVDRILLLRPVERRGENAAFQRGQHSIAHLGSSSSRRRSAVENTFPWASVLSEMVPPPSSAPCSRKFRAWRLGSSYRSTGPEIMPLKCRATRAAVTCFTRIG